MLRVINLSAGYGRLKAVSSVSLHVDNGEVVTLIGANGAGKSTLLRALAGLITPMEGRLLLRGKDVTRWPAERLASSGLCMVPEGRGLFPSMTVADNLEMGAYARRLSRAEARAEVARVLALFPELESRLRECAANLSGGQQQMVAIGRALAGKPDVLLMDEPSTGLAPALVAAIFDKIAELKRSGMTILLAEQNVHQALRTADRAYILENGRIVLDGTGAELMEDERVAKSYLGI